MNIERLGEYIELSRRLNFTLAARACHISQPALSNHIASLEREVGVTLVERSTGGGTRLTPAGQCFLEMATRIVDIYEETLPKLKSIQKEVKGAIRIRTPRREYSHPLLEYVFEFQNEYPNIEVVLAPWVEEDGYSDVASGKVDCAFVGQPSYIEDNAPYCQTNVVVYARNEHYLSMGKNHPLAQKSELTIRDLDGVCITIPANQKRLSWVALLQGLSMREGIEFKTKEKYCDSLEDFVMNELDADDLFLMGAGLTELPAFGLRTDRVTRPFTPPLRTQYAVAYAGDLDNPALQTFVAFLGRKYAQEAEGPFEERGGKSHTV